METEDKPTMQQIAAKGVEQGGISLSEAISIISATNKKKVKKIFKKISKRRKSELAQDLQNSKNQWTTF